MAVSGLEQRCVPLVVSSAVWSPWGPGLIAPYTRDDDDEHWDESQGGLKPLHQKRWRSHSWGSYSTHAQLTSHGYMPEPNLYNELETPLKQAVSDKIAAGRSLRGHKLRLSEMISPPLEPAPSPRVAIRDKRELRPALLGSSQSQVWITSQHGATRSAEQQADPPVELMAKPGSLGKSENGVVTTLAIQNLPYLLKQQDLLQAVDDSGFAGLYDFVNLPHKFKENRRIRNLGFAFINFVSEDVARQFTAEWQGSHRFTSSSLCKPLNIAPAAVQGRQAKRQKSTPNKQD